MESFSALLVLCAGNSPVTGVFPSQRPVTWSFAVFFDLRVNKRLSKQSWDGDLKRHCAHYDVTVMMSIQYGVPSILYMSYVTFYRYQCVFHVISRIQISDYTRRFCILFFNYFQNCVVCCCYNLLIHVYVLMTHICYVVFIHYLFKVFKKCFLHDLNFQDFQQRKLILDTTYWSCSWRWILYNMTSFILCKNLWQRSSIFECHRFLKDTWECCIFYSYFITFTQNFTHYFEGSCHEQLYEYISSSYSLIYQDVIVHYSDVIMDTLGSQLTSLTIVYSTMYSGTDQRKQQSSVALTFAWGIHRWLVNSPQKDQ